MSLQALQCAVCFQDYDLKQRLPKILPICGHTFCNECLSKVQKCPVDKKPFSTSYLGTRSIPTNEVLKEMLEKYSASGLCRVHNEKLQIVCLTDHVKICAFCVIDGAHKGHKTMLLKDIKAANDDVEEKKSDEIIDDSDGYFRSGFQSILEFDINGECLEIKIKDDKPRTVFLNEKKFLDIKEVKLTLTKLSTFRVVYGINIEALKNLWARLNNVKILRLIDEDRDRYFFETPMLGDLTTIFKSKPKALQEIELSFSNNYHLNDHNFISLMLGLLANTTCLKTLKLYLYGTEITEKSINTLCSIYLESAEVMKTFALGIGRTNVSRDAIERLLRSLPKVKNLELYLGETDIDDKALNLFIKDVLPTLKCLKSFQMCLWSTKITDSSVKRLLAGMGYVKKFMLNLGATHVTDESFINLMSGCLPLTQNLEEFRIDLEETSVSEQVLFSLSGMCSNLTEYNEYTY